jgi:hypothetical protein
MAGDHRRVAARYGAYDVDGCPLGRHGLHPSQLGAVLDS